MFIALPNVAPDKTKHVGEWKNLVRCKFILVHVKRWFFNQLQNLSNIPFVQLHIYLQVNQYVKQSHTAVGTSTKNQPIP
jgi:hypothetical protein